ncbi:MAG: mechanosensitive ion channel family protein [Hyphomonadaceae bacterium]
MTQPATTPAPATAPTPTLDTLYESLRSFVIGLVELDPEQAAIRGGLTLLVVIGAALLIWGLRLLLKALTERVAGEDTEQAPTRKLSIGRTSLGLARVVIVITAILVVLRLWGLDFSELMKGPLGAFVAGAVRIAIIVAIALAAIELCNLAIARVFGRVARRAKHPRRAAQIRTLAPLLGGVATTTLVLIAAMMALSEIGVEIGPLIAGAGIIGLAIGFGAQTLVKDFLTGIFLIVEDIVSVGDIVGIGEFGGVVEEMSLRTIKLRDFDGTLHVFPYSEAQVIHNRTKGFSMAAFDLSIDYNSDIGKALSIMRAIGEDLRKDAEYGPMILDDIEVVGVDQLADSAVMLKGRIKTLPAKQWSVRREYLKRIKAAFDEGGIEIPYPHLKVVPSAGGDGAHAFTPPPADR